MSRKALLLIFSVFLLFVVGCSDDSEEYGLKIRGASEDLLASAVIAEDVLGLYSDVWSFSIENSSPIPIHEMMDVTGFEEMDIIEHFEINNANNIPNDFSLNVHSVKSYYEDSGTIEEMENASSEIKEIVAELNNPPEEYEKAYDELLDMYNLTEEYIGLAKKPKGSLQDFNTTKSNLSSEILSKYKRIDVITPDKD